MDSKSLLGLVAGLGIMGVVATQTVKNPLEAETFMASQAIRKNKINYSGFKEIPLGNIFKSTFKTKKERDDWANIKTFQDWQYMDNYYEIKSRYHQLEPILAKQQVATYTQQQALDGTLFSYNQMMQSYGEVLGLTAKSNAKKVCSTQLKTATKHLKKLLSLVRKSLKKMKTNSIYGSRLPQDYAVNLYDAHPNIFAEAVESFNVYGSAFANELCALTPSFRYNPMVLERLPQGSSQFNQTLSSLMYFCTNLLDNENYMKQHTSTSGQTKTAMYNQDLQNRLSDYICNTTIRNFGSMLMRPFEMARNSNHYVNGDYTFPLKISEAIQKKALAKLNMEDVAILYQYSKFFEDNPSIKCVGTKPYPYSSRKEQYFTAIIYRKNTTFTLALPPNLRVSLNLLREVYQKNAKMVLKQITKNRDSATKWKDLNVVAIEKTMESYVKNAVPIMNNMLRGKAVKGRFNYIGDSFKKDANVIPEENRIHIAALIANMAYRAGANMHSIQCYPIVNFTNYTANQDGTISESKSSDNDNNRLNQSNGTLALMIAQGLTIPSSLVHHVKDQFINNDKDRIESSKAQIERLSNQIKVEIKKQITSNERLERQLVELSKLSFNQ